MITVYSLRKDTQRVEQVQKATLTTKDFGIQPTHGLFGSPDWWRNIENGELPVQTLRGIISRVYMGSMGDWPEFQVASEDNGITESFTRMFHKREQDAAYQVGKKIEVDYVWQKIKKRLRQGASIDTKVNLENRIDIT